VEALGREGVNYLRQQERSDSLYQPYEPQRSFRDGERIYIECIRASETTSSEGTPEYRLTSFLEAFSEATGDLLWKFETDRGTRPTKQVFDSVLLVSDLVPPLKKEGGRGDLGGIYWGVEGRLYALNKETGALGWEFHDEAATQLFTHGGYFEVRGDTMSTGGGGYSSGGWQQTSLVAAEGSVYIIEPGLEQRLLFALSAQTGKLLWKKSIPYLLNSVRVHAGHVYVPASNKLSVLRADTGETDWSIETNGSSINQCVLNGERIYLSTQEGLHVFSAERGELQWEFRWWNEAGGWDNQDIIVGETTVYFLHRELLYALDKATGKVKWGMDGLVPYPGSISGIETQGVLYLYSDRPSVLYAFDIAQLDKLSAESKRWWTLGWQFYRDKARSSYKEGMVQQAITEYQEAIKKAPETQFERLHLELGDIYRERGMEAEALAEYEQSQAQLKAEIERGSANSYVYNSLVWFYIEKKIKPKEAVSLAKKAVELAPGDANFLDTLGWVYLRNGQFEEALQTFAEVFSIDPRFDNSWRGVSEIAQVGSETPPPVAPEVFLQFCDEVAKALEKAGERTLPQVHLALAQFYERRGEKEKAQSEFAKTGFPKESSWLVIGPFDNTDDKGRTYPYPPETEINMNATYQGKVGAVKWQKAEDGRMDGRLDFTKIFTPTEWVVAYALIDVISPDDREAQLRIGSDDGVKVWLNGQVVWTNQVPRGLRLDEDVAPITLKKGTNRLLFKVDNGVEAWELTVRITDASGQPLEGLRFQAPQK
jgi:outer membrane protein assembly factor BamB/Tfp pilus assembly protein PilF